MFDRKTAGRRNRSGPPHRRPRPRIPVPAKSSTTPSGPVPLSWRRKVHAWLVLGRISNLPTVGSNCLAAWLLGGGGSWGKLAAVGAGAALLYTAGMFLNDAFDVEFDRRHRPERPIVSGVVGAG